MNHGTERCISFGGLRIDDAVGTEVLRVLKPLGIDAAVKALEAQTSETSAAQRQLELSLQQARYEAAHARRQYDAVDPANRLVAGELERRWNEALQAVHRIEGEIAAIEARQAAALGERERQQLMQLGADLELRLVASGRNGSDTQADLARGLNEIVVRVEGASHRDGPALAGRRPHRAAGKQRLNGAGKHRWTMPEDTIVAGPRAGAADARPADRAAPQSRRQADRARQRLDRAARARLPQSPRHCGLSRRRMGRARRDHARSGGTNHRCRAR